MCPGSARGHAEIRREITRRSAQISPDLPRSAEVGRNQPGSAGGGEGPACRRFLARSRPYAPADHQTAPRGRSSIRAPRVNATRARRAVSGERRQIASMPRGGSGLAGVRFDLAPGSAASSPCCSGYIRSRGSRTGPARARRHLARSRRDLAISTRSRRDRGTISAISRRDLASSVARGGAEMTETSTILGGGSLRCTVFDCKWPLSPIWPFHTTYSK